MSDAPQTILFEYPLNEKMRTWLRVEFLLKQLMNSHTLIDATDTLAFFRTMNELLDVFERGEIRTEILKELDKQQKKLQLWADVPGVDLERINALQQLLKTYSSELSSAPRLGQELKEDRLISLVRQRLSIPGGCCSFDLPSLHMWMHMQQSKRDLHVKSWLDKLAPLDNALSIILDLTRQSGPFKPEISINGFFQDNAEDADLLRMNLDLDLQIYPQVSGHKTRFAIRFLPLDSEHGKIPERLSFELSCC